MNDLLDRCPHLFQAPAVYLENEEVVQHCTLGALLQLPCADADAPKRLGDMTTEQVCAIVDKARAEIASNNALHFVDVPV